MALLNIMTLKSSLSALMQRASGQELSIFGLLGAATGLASDIYEPLLPSTLLWCIASVVGFLICLLLFQRAQENRDEGKEKIFGDGAILFGSSIPVIVLMTAIQIVSPPAPTDNESAIARLFPVVENFQVSMGVIDEKLTSIDEGIREVGKDVKGLREDVQGLKRETSEDPRKELANMGVQWSGENFLAAVAEGDMLIVNLFLDGGMRPESARNQGRPLPIMLGKNTFNPGEVIQALLAVGVDIDYAYPSGNISGTKTYTMLSWAIESENPTLVQALIDNGADLDGRIENVVVMGPASGSTPLALAAARGRIEIANLLLDNDADPSADEWLAYRALSRDSRRIGVRQGEAKVEALLKRLKPTGKAGEKIEAELELMRIKQELTDVAMESLRTVSGSEKTRLDTRYDELQRQRKALVDKYDLVDN